MLRPLPHWMQIIRSPDSKDFFIADLGDSTLGDESRKGTLEVAVLGTLWK